MKALLLLTFAGCAHQSHVDPAEPAPTITSTWSDPAYRICAELPVDMCMLGCVQLDHLECDEAGETIGACREACELAQATCRVTLDMGCIARMRACDVDACRVACDGGCP